MGQLLTDLMLALVAYRAENGAYTSFGRGSGKLRFVVILLVLVIAALGGLYIYGQMLEPDTRIIEQEALDVSQ